MSDASHLLGLDQNCLHIAAKNLVRVRISTVSLTVESNLEQSTDRPPILRCFRNKPWPIVKTNILKTSSKLTLLHAMSELQLLLKISCGTWIGIAQLFECWWLILINDDSSELVGLVGELQNCPKLLGSFSTETVRPGRRAQVSLSESSGHHWTNGWTMMNFLNMSNR